jgi:hypothetical protein
MNKTLLNAAKYIAKSRGFAVEYTGDPMFDSPLVSFVHQDTFAALHLLSCVATDSDPTLVCVRRVEDFLGTPDA